MACGARLAIETRGSIAGRVELSGILGCSDKAARGVLQALEERGEVIRGRDRRMYWADAASQRRRVIAIVETDGASIHGITALAQRAAAARTTIEDLVTEGRIALSSNSDLAHFFLCG